MKLSIRKTYISAIHDTIMAAISFVLTLYLRLGNEFDVRSDSVWVGALIFTSISIVVFSAFRMYQRSWRYISTNDLVALTKAVTLMTLFFLPLMFLYNRLDGVPRSAMLINWFILLAMLGGPRFLYRIIKERTLSINFTASDSQKISVIVAGANNYSEQFLREMVGDRNSIYRIVGIIDDDPQKKGQYIHGIKIYGDIASVGKVVEKLRQKGRPPSKILIAPDILAGDEVQSLLDICDSYGLTMARLPRLTDFNNAEGKKLEMRPIALEDLLGRPQKTLNRDIMKELVKGKRILITGAGGTIGGELVRQIASYLPENITLFENSEHNLYQIDKELDEKYPEIVKTPVIGDIRDRKKLDITFAEHKPQIVFHAAALKHVPMSELNISEAVLTNIIGTKNISDACIDASVEEMVMISTDKAVNPTNVMGATKRVAEGYIHAIGQAGKNKCTKFVTIRFGNVLGSTGSVIPLFKRQVEEGGPVTVTDPKVTRFFMTVREAVELVLQAAALSMSDDAYDSRIYVLDMGEPVLIKDLAEQVIRLAGLKPEIDIAIEYTGLRAGEKLYEELFHEFEEQIETSCDGIFLASPRESELTSLSKYIKKIESVATNRDDQKALELLKKILPEF